MCAACATRSSTSRSRSRRWNATTSASLSGPIASVAIITASRIVYRWMTACPTIERKIAGWKSERSGRRGCIWSTGVAYEKASEAIISSQEEAIICRSDERAPSRDRADSTYAEMSDSSIMICCC